MYQLRPKLLRLKVSRRKRLLNRLLRLHLVKNVRQRRKRNNEVPLELEAPPEQLTNTDIRSVVEDCLKMCSKDGLAWRNVENCFW